MNLSTKKYFPLLLIVIGFVLFKLSHLNLPHYWDESWSYATAVQLMYENGPTLLPGIVDVEATRGHPLFFYATAASWMKIFGASLISKHSFALFISILLLIAIYHICYKLYNIRVAFLSTLLFASQIFFFVQSSMLLPEVMVALFAFTSIYFFVYEKHIALSISLSCLYLTKESGFVLGMILGIAFLVSLFHKGFSRNKRIKMFFALLTPGLVILSFFVIQKLQYGWFFFPEHIGMVDTSLNEFSKKFRAMLFVVFIEEKRKWLWFIICGMVAFYSIRKKDYQYLLFLFALTIIFVFRYINLDFLEHPLFTIAFIIYVLLISVKYWNDTFPDKKQNRFLIIAGIFSIAYLIFSSINFYTVRYLMPVLLISLIAFGYWLDTILKNTSHKLYIPFALIVSALSVQSYLKNNSIGDTGLGSYNALKVQQSVINFLSNQNAQEKQIGMGSFLQKINMQNPACGFIKDKNQQFKNLNWEIDSKTDYAVFDNIEPDNRYEEIKNDKNFKLIYQVNEDNVWGAVFERNQIE